MTQPRQKRPRALYVTVLPNGKVWPETGFVAHSRSRLNVLPNERVFKYIPAPTTKKRGRRKAR